MARHHRAPALPGALKRRNHEAPAGERLWENWADPQPSLEETLVAAEATTLLRTAVGQLPDTQQRLITLILSDTASSYTEVSNVLAIPIGSIGPNQGRAFARLRTAMAAA